MAYCTSSMASICSWKRTTDKWVNQVVIDTIQYYFIIIIITSSSASRVQDNPSQVSYDIELGHKLFVIPQNVDDSEVYELLIVIMHFNDACEVDSTLSTFFEFYVSSDFICNSSGLLMHKICDFRNAKLTSRIFTLLETRIFFPFYKWV